jgi:hypothetical protein
MSIEQYKDAANSSVAKPNIKDHVFFFVGLKTMLADDVVLYMSKFLDLRKVGDDLVKHAGEWLKGRPRWVATFMAGVTPSGCRVTHSNLLYLW